MSRGICAIVPVKRLALAKSRLGAVMAADERAAFVLAMLRDVLSALAAARSISGVAVVTADPDAAALARDFGARVLNGAEDESYNGAVRWAARVLEAEGWDAVLVLPADLPCVTAGEIDAMAGGPCDAPCFAIAPAHDGEGSNAILCAPPSLVPASFGEDSFAAHMAAALASGVTPRVVKRAGLACDIDHPEDLTRLRASPGNSRAGALLRRAGPVPALAR